MLQNLAGMPSAEQAYEKFCGELQHQRCVCYQTQIALLRKNLLLNLSMRIIQTQDIAMLPILHTEFQLSHLSTCTRRTVA